MQTLMLLSILFASAFACADEKMESEIHIHSLKKNIDVKKFGGKYKLHPYGETKSKLPTLQKRDADFKKAGLTQELSKYDQLDLDILYTDAQRLPLNELKAKHFKLDESKLKKLQSLSKSK